MEGYERQTNIVPDIDDDTTPAKSPYALRLKDMREAMRDYEVNDIYLIELQAIMNGLAYYSRENVKPDSVYIKLTERLSILVNSMSKDPDTKQGMMDRLAEIIDEHKQ